MEGTVFRPFRITKKGAWLTMAEGREYISRPDEMGQINISEEVLATIAAAAAMEHGILLTEDLFSTVCSTYPCTKH